MKKSIIFVSVIVLILLKKITVLNLERQSKILPNSPYKANEMSLIVRLQADFQGFSRYRGFGSEVQPRLFNLKQQKTWKVVSPYLRPIIKTSIQPYLVKHGFGSLVLLLTACFRLIKLRALRLVEELQEVELDLINSIRSIKMLKWLRYV
jgi:hypothetical protein